MFSGVGGYSFFKIYIFFMYMSGLSACTAL